MAHTFPPESVNVLMSRLLIVVVGAGSVGEGRVEDEEEAKVVDGARIEDDAGLSVVSVVAGVGSSACSARHPVHTIRRARRAKARMYPT